ncbi:MULTISPECIES: hypothetical protein [Corynebacterium]|jgi:hypothetical protein|uniref:hypothetical protein n=1 Tax=Corynebacterium TaxID=1716 RepID=UPI0003B8CFFD|nr:MULTISPECIES: hypothetical protein [Corynebacterium]ERS41731.1 hypothetical protein HMPREF1293_01880 [Corynebacterium sp. KPL1996]ERS44560.1 hypothetical protein HMPREF1287_01051 [Corynebacterium sp. KPL1986]ERS72485.1 hypothetical protein HMPREF1295_01410 [Corynebacterium sp. KPL1998]ERS74056.1 hypothetical protein HMPREF1300_01041 [Corynebacterium sp. KPL2004]MCT1409413.1 hypothetical protein [Corynebacterium accolens]
MNQALTNIPSIRQNHPTFWHDLDNGTYLKLAPRIAVHRDHYRSLPLPAQLRLRAIAAARSAYTAVLISKSAARVHGLWVLASTEEKVEMALPCNSLPHKDRRHPDRIYRKATIPAPDTVDGARTVSKARAVIDVARYHGFRNGLVAADSALRAGITKEDMTQEHARMGRVRNSSTVREVIHHCSELSRSPYESFARALLIQAEFPWPLFFQARYTAVAGIVVALCINNTYIIEVEACSCEQSSHITDTEFSTPATAAHHLRENRLRAAGYTVLRYCPHRLVEHPQRFVSAVTSVISARQNSLRSQRNRNNAAT